MSNYLAIAAVTSALKQLLLNGLQNAPWDFPYDVTVTTAAPDVARPQALDTSGQINLFLYHTAPNAAWRNELRQGKTGGSGFAPLALDLRYLITAYAPENDGVEVHRILGRALGVLHDHAILSATEMKAALLNSDVHEQLERIRLTPLTISVEEMSSLWSMCQKAYNLSVAWQASVVLIESLRAARAPLPVLTRGSAPAGAGDQGITLQPNVGPVTPGIESLSPPAQQASVRLGEALTIDGHLLAGDMVRVIVNHTRWTSTKYLLPDSVSAWKVSVTLPSGGTAEAEWPAGTYMLSVGVTRVLGGPEIVTNELPFTLAPTMPSISPTSGTPDLNGEIVLTVDVAPEVWPQQRVSVIVGDRTFKAEPFAVKADSLQFTLGGLGSGTYRVRLRVDGVDSLVVDKTTKPPSFVGPELEVL